MNNNNIYGSPPDPTPDFKIGDIVKHIDSGRKMTVKNLITKINQNLNREVVSIRCGWGNENGAEELGDFLLNEIEFVSRPHQII